MQNDWDSDLYTLKAVYNPVVIITVLIPFFNKYLGLLGTKG